MDWTSEASCLHRKVAAPSSGSMQPSASFRVPQPFRDIAAVGASRRASQHAGRRTGFIRRDRYNPTARDALIDVQQRVTAYLRQLSKSDRGQAARGAGRWFSIVRCFHAVPQSPRGSLTQKANLSNVALILISALLRGASTRRTLSDSASSVTVYRRGLPSGSTGSRYPSAKHDSLIRSSRPRRPSLGASRLGSG